VHGRGLFAARRIRPDSQLIEYKGERLNEAEVEARYPESVADDPHTLLFQIGGGSCIDAAVGGNAARFINHSCQPNCEPRQDGDRIFIFSIRNIQPGVELAYDYSLVIERGYSAERARIYACRCGAPRCRGTMLARRKRS
jgi:SET domain-containing protein